MRLTTPKGQALTEFLLVIPLFFILLLGVLQFSLLSFAYQVVHYASFAACRAAIVRPCAAFNPDEDEEDHFAPEVFAAAVLANMAAAPSQPLFSSMPYDWMPLLPETGPVRNLDFEAGEGGDSDIAQYKYINAAFLTGVLRVEPDYNETPTLWTPTDEGGGPGIPCMDYQNNELEPREQNVPPTGHDISLEVTLIYPMIVPLVNRVFYGIFVNFSDLATYLGLSEISGSPGQDVMRYPTQTLPGHTVYAGSINQAVSAMIDALGFGSASAAADIPSAFEQRLWYPLPVRARTTLTVEGSVYPLLYNVN